MTASVPMLGGSEPSPAPRRALVSGTPPAAPSFDYTVFLDRTALSRQTQASTWPELAKMLVDPPRVVAKDKQPLLKLATFGERRNESGCYRTDGNVLRITGVEGDYDAKAVTPEEAIARLERHGVRALVYTSWSHADAAPRWRVLAPTSRPLAPSERERLVARLNGTLGGILARESFVLSQSYYFGRNADGEYRCLTTFDDPEEGECIDDRSALDPIAIGKPAPATPVAAWRPGAPLASAGTGGHEDWLKAMLDGDDVHGNALRVVGRMVNKGLDDATIKATFRAMHPEIARVRGSERARVLIGAELDRMIAGARAKGFAPRTDDEIKADVHALLNEINLTATELDVPALVKRIAEVNPKNASEVDTLLRAMKKRFGTTITSLKDDLKVAKAERAREVRGGGPAPKEPDQSTHASTVLDRIGPDNVHFTLDAFFLWDNAGVWRRADDREVKQVAQDVLDDDESVPVSKALVDGVLDNIKNTCFTKDRLFEPDNMRGRLLVNTSNGTIEWDEAASAWKMREHRREDYLITQLPIPYDATARAPRFEQFLAEVFDGDPDAAQKAECVLELIGYSVLATARYEKFVILIGGGANGKSVLLSVLEHIIGPRCVAAVQPSQLDNKFQRAHLHGKLVNLVSEIAEGAEIPDAELKAIVSGEAMTAEHKNRDPFEFHPYATCWFGTNHLPHTRDFSNATFRRAIVLKFNNTFDGARCDPNLSEKLIGETPGILAMALDRFRGVIARKGFTIPASSIEAAREWRRDVDQVAQFLDERCTADKAACVASADFYADYRTWADAAGVARKLGRKAFTTRVVAAGGDARKSGRDGTRMIYGWALRPRVA